jgi:hypothetical protein
MNDRFKFRVWDKEKIVLHYNAECAYDYMGGTPPLMEDSFGGVLCNEDYVIEQCTGVKDKNGNLIYEGDVVKTVTGDVGIVQWIPARAGFLVYFPNNSCCLVHETQEIIGNIHEEGNKKRIVYDVFNGRNAGF